MKKGEKFVLSIKEYALLSMSFLFFIFPSNLKAELTILSLEKIVGPQPGIKLPVEANLNRDVSPGQLILFRAGFNTLASPRSIYTQRGLSMDVGVNKKKEDTIEPKLIGKILNYPNPFRHSQGTDVGYRLSKDMTVEIFIYDILGNLILQEMFPAGSPGGMGGYNRLKINLSTFEKEFLSASIYFYYLLYSGKILGYGKMAVIP